MKKLGIITCFWLCALTAKAQTGFFIYHDTVKGKPHVQVTDIREGADRKIYLAGEAKDEDFKTTSPWFAQVSGKGALLHKSSVPMDVTDIRRIVPVQEKGEMIYGNFMSPEGRSQPYTALLNEKGKAGPSSIPASKYAVVLGDVVPFSKTHNLVVQSNRKENGTYNLVLLKTPDARFSPAQFAAIDSKSNEIATQVVVNKKKEIFITGYRATTGQPLAAFVYALDSTGKQLWSATPDIPQSFLNLRIGLNRKEEVIVAAGYRSGNGPCRTVLWISDETGKNTSLKPLENIKSNGMILLKNGNLLVYGTHFMVHDKRFIISKGSFVILDQELKEVIADVMKMTDEPDVSLAPLAMSAQPTSSEFNTGIQLSDGRIVLGGRISYPEFPEQEKILGCTYYNEACLLFLAEDGKRK